METTMESAEKGGGCWGLEETGEVLEGVEGVVVQVREHYGHAWCWEGRVYFGRGAVEGGWSGLGAGAGVRVWARRQTEGEWKASRLRRVEEGESGVSRLAVGGMGLVSRTEKGHAFVESPVFPERVFAPGFAAAPVEMSSLLASRVHFLAIPNPKPGFTSKFIISLHAWGSECGEGGAGSAEHWLLGGGGGGGGVGGGGVLAVVAVVVVVVLVLVVAAAAAVEGRGRGDRSAGIATEARSRLTWTCETRKVWKSVTVTSPTSATPTAIFALARWGW